MSEKVELPKRVYFFGFSYAVGGGDIFYFRLIDYLLHYTDIKVGIIDFADGILTRTVQKFFANDDIDCIDYMQSDWPLENNSCIFCPLDRIGCIKNIEAKNVKIVDYFWNTDVGWSILFEKNVFKKLSKLLYETNACAFMDYGCYAYACQAFKQNFTKQYIPLFFYNDSTVKINKESHEDEINLVWLGRISSSKTFSLMNVIENFYAYPTKKKKILHIIGNGIDLDNLKLYCKKYENCIQFIFTGVLTGNNLNEYLLKNADVGVAMGTSLLNFASIGLPVMAAHEPRGFFHSDKFQWLFNVYEYCLGSPIEENDIFAPMFQNISCFNDMLDDISLYGKKDELGQKCKFYFEQIHGNLKGVGETLVNSLSRTKLTSEMLKKCFKFIPYGGEQGIAVHYFKILGIKFKVIHHRNKMRVYFGKLCLAKLVRNPEEIKYYVLGLRLLKSKWWGRYSFPSITSEQIKEECKDKYSISKRLFED